MNAKTIFGAAVGAIALATFARPIAPARAQTADELNPVADPLEVLEDESEIDPFSGAGAGDLDVFELIHRSNLSGGTSLGDYLLQQQTNLDDAAAQFRARQVELLEQQRAAELEAVEEIENAEIENVEELENVEATEEIDAETEARETTAAETEETAAE